jgi:WD40 repeat protein
MMSNLDQCEVADDSHSEARSASGWYTVAGTVGLILLGIVLYSSTENLPEVSTNETVVKPRTVIHWRQTPVFSLAWSPDSRRLAASCFGPVVRVWDRETGDVSSHEGGTEQPRFALGWSEDGRRLMVSGLDLPIESWDLFRKEDDEGAGVTRPVDRSATTAALVKTTGARPIRLWGPSDRRFGIKENGGQSANTIAFSADGRFLATGGIGGRLEILDLPSGKVQRTIEVDSRGITAVSFSPDGSNLATSGPGPVRIWESQSGHELHRLGEEQSGSATLGFSPDGSRLAVASWDGSIVVWELTTALPTFKLRGHQGQILSLAWSPDGKTLASGGYDSTVKVWDLSVPVLKTASR